MFFDAHIDKDFFNGGFEILIKYIVEDLNKNMNIDEIHKFYFDLGYSLGKNKEPLTEEQFFLAFKSAQLIYNDQIEFEKARKAKQIFRRSQ